MTDEAGSPLRRRMIEDMPIGKLAPKTQRDYVQRIKSVKSLRTTTPISRAKATLRRSCRPALDGGPLASKGRPC